MKNQDPHTAHQKCQGLKGILTELSSKLFQSSSLHVDHGCPHLDFADAHLDFADAGS